MLLKAEIPAELSAPGSTKIPAEMMITANCAVNSERAETIRDATSTNINSNTKLSSRY